MTPELNRRDILKCFTTITVASSLWGIVDRLWFIDNMKWILNNILNSENSQDNKKTHKIQKELEEWKNVEDIMSEINHSEHWSEKQVLLNFALATFFCTVIIKYFMAWETNKALTFSIPVVSNYYYFSDEETKHHFLKELEEAWISVWIMTLIITWVESIKAFNIEKMATSEVRIKYWDEIKNIWKSSYEAKQILNELNIEISKDENFNHIKISNEAETEKKIIISTDIFVEILPLLKTWNIDEIRNKISFYFDDKKRRDKAIEVMSDCENKHINVLENSKNSIDTLTANIIKDEINTLLSFVLIFQMITWVWQAAIIKNRIYHIGNMLKNLAISNWITEKDATNIESSFIWITITYFFNRQSIYSDLWPVMWAFAKWWMPWFVAFVDWLLPVALLNIIPFLNSIDDLIIKTWVINHFKVSWKRYYGKDKKLVWDISKKTLNICNIFWKNIKEPNEAFQAPELIENSRVRKSIKTQLKNNPEEIKNSEIKIEKINEIDSLFSDVNLLSDIKVKKIIDIDPFYSDIISPSNNDNDNFSSWIDAINMLMIYYNDEKCVELIDELLQKHSKKIIKFYESIKKCVTRDKEKNIIKEVLKFIEENLDLGNDNNWTEYVFDLLFSQLKDEGNESYSEKYKKLKNLNWIFDLEFCLEEKTQKIWWIKWISNMIQINLKFLIFIKEKIVNNRENQKIYDQLLKNFTNNLDNIEQKTYDEILPFLWKYLRYEEKNIFNENTHKSKIKNTTKEDEKEAKEKFVKIKAFLENTFGKSFETIEVFIEYWEEYLWKNSFEVIQMILLIQTPYILAMRETIKSAINELPKLTWYETKKYLIWLSTYVISMFADNYVWLVVWVELAKDLLWIDAMEAIRYIWKFSVIGWSKVITWNAPNAIVNKKWVPDFYDVNSLTPDIEKDYDRILWKDAWKINNFVHSTKDVFWIPWGIIKDLVYDSFSLYLTPSASGITKEIKPTNIIWALMQNFRYKILKKI